MTRTKQTARRPGPSRHECLKKHLTAAKRHAPDRLSYPELQANYPNFRRTLTRKQYGKQLDSIQSSADDVMALSKYEYVHRYDPGLDPRTNPQPLPPVVTGPLGEPGEKAVGVKYARQLGLATDLFMGVARDADLGDVLASIAEVGSIDDLGLRTRKPVIEKDRKSLRALLVKRWTVSRAIRALSVLVYDHRDPPAKRRRK